MLMCWPNQWSKSWDATLAQQANLAEREDIVSHPASYTGSCSQCGMRHEQPPDEGEEVSKDGPAAGANLATLPALPAELIDAIGSLLSLRDRLRLTSCCALLWRRTDVAASVALWGALHLPKKLENPALGQSLCAWLRRRRRALQHLHLPGMLPAWLEPLLVALEGSNVQHLSLCHSRKLGLEGGVALTALSRLSALRCLDLGSCQLKEVPSQLAALGSSLSRLRLSGNPLGAAREAGLVRRAQWEVWQPLSALTALTRLDLHRCELEHIPAAVHFLGACLVELNLSGTSTVVLFDFPAGLTRLDLSYCGLQQLPQQLTALPPSLRNLSLKGNVPLGRLPADTAFGPLLLLTGLVQLDLRDCGLRCLPPQLQALQALTYLQLSLNPELSRAAIVLGEEAHIDRSGIGAEVATLSDLPRELIDAIGSLLSLRDRMSLTSCCALLWRRTDVAASVAIWGALHLPKKLENPALLWSLCVWLRRRRRALQHLHLPGMLPARLGPVLVALEGSNLAALAALQSLLADSNPSLGRHVSTAFAPLRALTRLTALQLSVYAPKRLPTLLAALSTSLASLELTGNLQVDISLPGLERLTALTRLVLAECELPRLPPQVSALTRLAELQLAGSGLSDEEGRPAHLQLLSALPALTHLDLSSCSLRRPPAALSLLQRLRCLGLGGNFTLRHIGEAQSDMWQPLAALTALTRLDLRRCRLDSMPAPVHFLGASLVELHLGRRPEPVVFDFSTGLTSLHLSHCGLKQLPPQITALAPSLRHLNLEGNVTLGRQPAETAFAHLLHLTGLVHLDLTDCDLRRLPAQLQALQALTYLRLSLNHGLSGDSESQLPQELTVLAPSLRNLGLARNIIYSEVLDLQPPDLQPLLHLTRLVQLDLRGCRLGTLRAQLQALKAVTDLELS
ncbi:hypothetical protein N2152v2_010021 [Parachlorella kessleri]